MMNSKNHIKALSQTASRGPVAGKVDVLFKKPDFATSAFFISLINALIAQTILDDARRNSEES